MSYKSPGAIGLVTLLALLLFGPPLTMAQDADALAEFARKAQVKGAKTLSGPW